VRLWINNMRPSFFTMSELDKGPCLSEYNLQIATLTSGYCPFRQDKER